MISLHRVMARHEPIYLNSQIKLDPTISSKVYEDTYKRLTLRIRYRLAECTITALGGRKHTVGKTDSLPEA